MINVNGFIKPFGNEGDWDANALRAKLENMQFNKNQVDEIMNLEPVCILAVVKSYRHLGRPIRSFDKYCEDVMIIVRCIQALNQLFYTEGNIITRRGIFKVTDYKFPSAYHKYVLSPVLQMFAGRVTDNLRVEFNLNPEFIPTPQEVENAFMDLAALTRNRDIVKEMTAVTHTDRTATQITAEDVRICDSKGNIYGAFPKDKEDLCVVFCSKVCLDKIIRPIAKVDELVDSLM